MITIRDPLWDTIRLDAVAVRIVDSAAFQRLRHIKQLGHAHLVYPGATHTRFDHALGVYHLAQRALAVLHAGGWLDTVDPAHGRLTPMAALLHDIGHYPFSHALEELEEAAIPGNHEALAGRFLGDGELRAALEAVIPAGAELAEALIRGRSDSPLQGLVSGSLDLDKIEYLKRDARFCGVPYGEVDVDRLLHALCILPDPVTGRPEVGVLEKGVAALESLLFAKYQMFRNVYWHHAVRAATVIYKRIVADALAHGIIAPDELVGATDEGLLHLLEERASGRASGTLADREDPARNEVAQRLTRWVGALRARRLPKRAVELAAAELEEVGGTIPDWVAIDSTLKRNVEDRLAEELGLSPGSVFLDGPHKPAMFALDLLVRRRSGEVIRVGPRGQAGLIGLPQIADQLYQSARVLRLFTLERRVAVDPMSVARLGTATRESVKARLDGGGPLLV